MSIIIFIIILAILILVHEFGHFIVAKKSGIRVDEFGLGFPPKLYAKKFGGTLYTLNLIPFGGFVKIFGEDPHAENISEADKPTSFYYKPKWIQALVLVAGITMNLIFAWLVISLGFAIGLPSPVDHEGMGTVTNAHLVITEILQNSPAEKAGLQTGDEILLASSGNTTVQDKDLTPDSIQNLIKNSSSKIDLTYKRGGSAPVIISVEPNTTAVPGRRALGIGTDNIGTLRLPIYLAVIQGALTTWILIKGTVVGLGAFFWHIVVFKSDFSQVSGPIGIASVVKQATGLGFSYLLTLIALISINLAIINLLPFPALDGGRLFFLLIEAIIRRPLSPKFVRYANTTGFALLIILMVVVSVHDVLKFL